MGHPRKQAKSTFCMHCPGSGKRHWDGWACALFCLLRWRTGGCSLVYDEERWLCLCVVFVFFFSFTLSFRTHDVIRVFLDAWRIQGMEASTWNVLMSIMDLEEHISLQLQPGAGRKGRAHTNKRSREALAWEYPTTAFTRGRPNRRSRMACQVSESLAMLKKPYLAIHTNKIWDLNFTHSLEPLSNLLRPSLR
ncbi:hypothetical protein QBC45DRAFT_3217 [Copromyces sp. CBS 386.78]|nr:hypothetical protein QBC45DRAFT_3217 [Copromyces sp. CBS 386.78]